MEKKRHVITYGDYFHDFFEKQTPKVRDPITYLRIIEGTNGLYEVRVKLASNIFRIFCFFDGNKFVILLTAFQKKSQKTPLKEIRRAEALMKQYFKEKEGEAI